MDAQPKTPAQACARRPKYRPPTLAISAMGCWSPSHTFTLQEERDACDFGRCRHHLDVTTILDRHDPGFLVIDFRLLSMGNFVGIVAVPGAKNGVLIAVSVFFGAVNSGETAGCVFHD